MPKLSKIEIHAIGGIDDLTLSFHPGLNLICGPNGIGKTTILECISHSFTEAKSSTIKRNSLYDSGRWKTTIFHDEVEASSTFETKYFHPAEETIFYPKTFVTHLPSLLVFKSNRQLDYIEVPAITKDPIQRTFTLSTEINTLGTSPNNIKAWFLARYLWSAHPGQLNESQIDNFNLAIQCFKIIDPNISFKRVIPDTNEIVLNTFGKEIYFEYLSSGYKSISILLLGLIKEIEHRFKNPGIKVREFDGIILIDEADLHLHPLWQAKLIHVLKELVPNAQFIITSHSPHMIQAVEPNELISLGFDDDNKVYVRDLPSSEYGYQGWTVEEILQDVMGLEETRSQTYLETMNDFEEALNQENVQQAELLFSTLNKMLHPRNPVIKILEIQLASIGGELDD